MAPAGTAFFDLEKERLCQSKRTVQVSAGDVSTADVSTADVSTADVSLTQSPNLTLCVSVMFVKDFI